MSIDLRAGDSILTLIDGDVTAQLEHKLAESLWWVIVLADRLDIDITEAFATTMDQIERGLDAAINRS